MVMVISVPPPTLPILGLISNMSKGNKESPKIDIIILFDDAHIHE